MTNIVEYDAASTPELIRGEYPNIKKIQNLLEKDLYHFSTGAQYRMSMDQLSAEIERNLFKPENLKPIVSRVLNNVLKLLNGVEDDLPAILNGRHGAEARKGISVYDETDSKAIGNLQFNFALACKNLEVLTKFRYRFDDKDCEFYDSLKNITGFSF